jgi:hypothetical protein
MRIRSIVAGARAFFRDSYVVLTRLLQTRGTLSAMRGQRRTTIIVVGGALAIASVGYGLGSQAGDGNAIADSTTDQDGSAQEHRNGAPPPLEFDRGAPPGFSQLADELGVDTNALMRAMRDFHDQHDADRRHDFAAALAKALGVSTDRVDSALSRLRPGPGGPGFGDGDRDKAFADHERRFAERLANALGVSVDDMKAALETPGPVLVDVRVTREENVYPMIPAGQAARDMVG